MTYIHDQGQWKNFIYRMNFEIFNFSIYYLTNRIWIFNPDVTVTFPNENLGLGSVPLHPLGPPPLFIYIKTLNYRYLFKFIHILKTYKSYIKNATVSAVEFSTFLEPQSTAGAIAYYLFWWTRWLFIKKFLWICLVLV